MKGIYLFTNRARHPNHDIVYNDVEEKYKCDITANAFDVQLDEYDFIIATPPCNWWSLIIFSQTLRSAMFTICIETSATAYKYSVCSARIRASHSLPGI